MYAYLENPMTWNMARLLRLQRGYCYLLHEICVHRLVPKKNDLKYLRSVLTFEITET